MNSRSLADRGTFLSYPPGYLAYSFIAADLFEGFTKNNYFHSYPQFPLYLQREWYVLDAHDAMNVCTSVYGLRCR